MASSDGPRTHQQASDKGARDHVLCQTSALNLPVELQDDQQAAVLYSPFRDKSVNPRSWSRKMEFWAALLLSTALERDIISFDSNTLPALFERKGMTPKCLKTVIEELKRSGKLQFLEDYNRTEGWLSWGLNSLVKQPLSWGVSRILGSANKNSNIYVWPEVVQKVSDKLVDFHHRNMQHEVTDCVTTLAAFRGECLPLVPQDEDFNIVLQNLKKSGRVQIKDLEDGTVVVKLCKRGQSTAEPFKDTDIQIYRITVTQKKLEEEAELLSSRIDGFTEEARSYVQQGRKTLALYSLRKKKATQKVLDRKSACIMKLQDIVIKIEEARTNAMVITACETGVAALKSLEKDLNIDRVEAVMDEVGEALEDQEEISSAMEAAFPAHQRDLEEDLEQELQELLSGNRDEIVDISLPHDDSLSLKLSSLCVDDMGLPNVPTHSPSGSAASRKNSPSSVKTALYS